MTDAYINISLRPKGVNETQWNLVPKISALNLPSAPPESKEIEEDEEAEIEVGPVKKLRK